MDCPIFLIISRDKVRLWQARTELAVDMLSEVLIIEIQANCIIVLEGNPKRWSKIYSMSRRPPMGVGAKYAQHVACDFLEPPEKLAEIFRKENVRA